MSFDPHTGLLKAGGVLTAKGRGQVKDKNFAINRKGDDDSYPIHDRRHAANALTRVRQYGTPSEKSKVYAAVAKKYPGLAAESSIKAVQKKTKTAGLKLAEGQEDSLATLDAIAAHAKAGKHLRSARRAEQDMRMREEAQRSNTLKGALLGGGTGLGLGGMGALVSPRHAKALLVGGPVLGTLLGGGMGSLYSSGKHGTRQEAMRRMAHHTNEARDLMKMGEGQVVNDLPEMDQQEKEDPGPPPPPPPKDMSKSKKKLPEHPAWTAAKTIGGAGLGFGAGYGAMHGLDYALQKVRGQGQGLPAGKLRYVIPAASTVLGIGVPYLYQGTIDKMRQSHLERQKTAAEMKQDNFEGLVRPKKELTEQKKKFLALLRKVDSR